MKTEFMNEFDDIEWLNSTHLKGVPLPKQWSAYKSYVLQGNEDAPYAVNLYPSDNPNFDDDFYRVRFVNDSGAYAEACQYDGRSRRPIGGMAELT